MHFPCNWRWSAHSSICTIPCMQKGAYFMCFIGWNGVFVCGERNIYAWVLYDWEKGLASVERDSAMNCSDRLSYIQFTRAIRKRKLQGAFLVMVDRDICDDHRTQHMWLDRQTHHRQTISAHHVGVFVHKFRCMCRRGLWDLRNSIKCICERGRKSGLIVVVSVSVPVDKGLCWWDDRGDESSPHQATSAPRALCNRLIV